MSLRVFVNTKFEGHWPVGVAAVVFADSPQDAAMHLSAELATAGLPQSVAVEDMVEIRPLSPRAYILHDGNY